MNDLTLSNCAFMSGFNLRNAHLTVVDSCNFSSHVTLISPHRYGEIAISNSLFQSGLTIETDGILTLEGSIIKHGFLYNSPATSASLVKNNFVSSDSAGLVINHDGVRVIKNNIICNNRQGIVVAEEVNDDLIQFEYNDFWDNEEGNYVGIQPGVGSISANPMFFDAEAGYYQLRAESPCIDAGDPRSPLDPDGSRADMGAIPFRHPESVENLGGIPEIFNLTVSPNPFNDLTTLYFKCEDVGGTAVTVFNIHGREILKREFGHKNGIQRLHIDGRMLGAPGVYFARVKSRQNNITLKLVYIP